MNQSMLKIGLTIAILFGATGFNSAVADDHDGVSDNRRTARVIAVERALRCTVNIHSEKRARTGDGSLYPAGKKVNGMGTGIVLDEKGYIVTNYHVVQDVDLLKVTLHDGASYTARVVHFDNQKDLAVIKITPLAPLEVMPLGTSSDLMLAEDVIAIGNAFGYSDTVSQGIISALGRDVEVNDEQGYQNLIQHDAAINPGNSGGPLINRDGDVIGINVAIRQGAQKIGFAIPIDDARKIIAQLISVERLSHTYHGINTSDEKQGADRKLVVTTIDADSPGAVMGIEVGDVITKVDGVDVVDRVDLERVLLRRAAGEQATIEYRHEEEVTSNTLAVARLSGSRNHPARSSLPGNAPIPPTIAAGASNADKSWNLIGLTLEKMDSTDRIFQGQSYRGGMRVKDVRPGSPAAQNGIRSNDVLVGFHAWQTVTVANVDYVLNHPNFGTFSPLKFYILRDTETLYGHFQVASK